MDYSNLFKFRFVDREQARATFNDYLLHETTTLLWIDGYRGVGKTALVDYMINQYPHYAYCYLDIDRFENDQELVNTFIETLQTISNKKFINSVKKHFKALYQKSSGSIINLLSEWRPGIGAFTGLLLDLGYYALTYKEEQTDAREIAVKYIEDVASVKPLFICIDNFSNSSTKVYEFFSYVLKSCLSNHYIKLCVVTNTGDQHWETIHRHIITEYPHMLIHLDGLEKAEYFYEILHIIFQMDSFSEREIFELFNSCDGNPYFLSTLIYKLIEQKGIIQHKGSKPEINKLVLFRILKERDVAFKDNDFTAQEKWVLFSYYAIGRKASLNAITELSDYISRDNLLFTGFKRDIIGETLLSLIEKNILQIDGEFIEAKSELTFKSIQMIFEHSPIRDVFSYYALKYYAIHSEIPENEKQISYLSYIAGLPQWEDINYKYAHRLFLQKHYEEASTVFYRLSSSRHSIASSQKLIIGKCYYEGGFFTRSVKVLESINPKELQNSEERIDYYMYCGKAYNTTGDMNKACTSLEQAREIANTQSCQYVELLNLLQMYYCEIPGKKEFALRCFNEVKNNYKDKFPVLWAKTMRGCQNFMDNTPAIDLLDEAVLVVNDPLDVAYIENTKGFLYIRMNSLKQAKDLFYKAAVSIKKLKPHEYSYAANNYSICCMLEGDYSTAKEYLIEALLWNNTVYGSITIKVHLMIATLYLKEYEECQSYLNDLESYLQAEKPADEIILRKLYMNFSIVYRALYNYERSNNYLKRAGQYVFGTSSQKRYELLCENKDNNANSFFDTTSFDPWFLIYAHD